MQQHHEIDEDECEWNRSDNKQKLEREKKRKKFLFHDLLFLACLSLAGFCLHKYKTVLIICFYIGNMAVWFLGIDAQSSAIPYGFMNYFRCIKLFVYSDSRYCCANKNYLRLFINTSDVRTKIMCLYFLSTDDWSRAINQKRKTKRILSEFVFK